MDQVRTALSELSLSQLATTAFVLLAVIVLGPVRTWRLSRLSVRRAAASADPEVRQAAVLVASCDGPARHLSTLRRLRSTETDDTVLGALAQVLRSELPSRRSTADLRRWAHAYSPPGRLPPAPAPLPLGPGGASNAFAHLIDALELVDALDRRERPKALPPGPGTTPQQTWRGHPDQIDPLEVVGAMASASTRTHVEETAPQTANAPSRTRTWRAGADGIDPLVVSGVSPCDCGQLAPTRGRASTPQARAGVAARGSRRAPAGGRPSPLGQPPQTARPRPRSPRRSQMS